MQAVIPVPHQGLGELKEDIGKFNDNWAQKDPISEDESKAESSGMDYGDSEEDQYVCHSGGGASRD